MIWRTAICDTFLIAAALPIVIGGCGRTASRTSPSPPAHAAAKPAESPRRSSLNRIDNSLPGAAATRSATTVIDPATLPAVLTPDSRSQTIHRPDDQRPKHDDGRLAEAGIRVYESPRLKLYTDIDAEVARTLPPLIDAVCLAWGEYFGELPPARDGSEFQMTGYLIRDEALFREAGLVPEDLPMFEHGRHRRNEFWLREQKYDYFRRHLLIHEATHCFMTFLPGVAAPVWYIEGMAEYFATHRIEPDGSVSFRVMPTAPEDFAGWGRITAIRSDFAAKQGKSISEITAWQPTEFLKPEPYAWSWALCQFLDAHPRYREPFRKLGAHAQGHAFRREFAALFHEFERELNTEWELFAANLQYGYEATRAAIDFQPGTPFTSEQPSRRIDLAADRGWQSSRVRLEAGQTYTIAASGRFTLADQPKPWISEPQGITFRYFDRRPLGLLIGCVHEGAEAPGREQTTRARVPPESAQREPIQRDLVSMLQVFEIGRGRSFTASHTGTLYLRVNEAWNSLGDNHGHVAVTVERSRTGEGSVKDVNGR